MAVTGLEVILGLNAGPFSRGITKAAGQVQSFSARVTAGARTVLRYGSALTAVAGGAGFGYLIANSFKTIDAIGKLSDEIGISTERLVGMQHAAAITGTGTENLTKGLQRLVRRLGESASGYGEGVKGLEQLGLSAQQLVAMSPAQAIEQVAESIKGIEDPTRRAAAAYALFGRQGQELMNFLMLGRKGLQAAQQEAEKLGITFSRSAAKKVEAFNDAMERLRKTMKGFAQTAAIELSGWLEKLTNTMTGLLQMLRNVDASVWSTVKSTAAWVAGIGAAIFIIPKLVSALVTVVKGIAAVVKATIWLQAFAGPAAWWALGAGIGIAILATGKLSRKFDELTKSASDAVHEAQQVGANLNKIGGAAAEAGEGFAGMAQNIADATDAMGKHASKIQEMIDAQWEAFEAAKYTADQMQQLQAMRGGATAEQLRRLQSTQSLRAGEENIQKVRDIMAGLKEQVFTVGLSEEAKTFRELIARGVGQPVLERAALLMNATKELQALENRPAAARFGGVAAFESLSLRHAPGTGGDAVVKKLDETKRIDERRNQILERIERLIGKDEIVGLQ